MDEDPFVARLTREVADWSREGLTDATTTRKIRRRYRIALPEGEKAAGQGRTATIIGSLGSILVGLGVILFVASNWQGIDRYLKPTLLLAVLVGSAAAAFLLRTYGHPLVGAAAVFVSSLVFGANIFLVGQVYHVRSSDPTFLLIWAAGLLPMAYVANSRLTLFVSLAALVGWYGMLLQDWRVWGGPHPLVAPAFLGLGLMYVAAAGVLSRFPRTAPFAPITRIVGLVVAFDVLYALTFEGLWRSAARAVSEKDGAPTGFLLSVVALLLAAVGAALWKALLSRSEAFAWVEAGGCVVLLLVTLVMVLARPFDTPGPYALTFNLVVLAAVIWAVVLGVATTRESLINLALTMFGILVITRYFDFFDRLLDRSLGFIGAGMLLLVGGFLLERSRRFLLTQSQSLEVSDAN